MTAGKRFNNLTDFACADTFAQNLQVFNLTCRVHTTLPEWLKDFQK
jgi:hypothetical protein